MCCGRAFVNQYIHTPVKTSLKDIEGSSCYPRYARVTPIISKPFGILQWPFRVSRTKPHCPAVFRFLAKLFASISEKDFSLPGLRFRSSAQVFQLAKRSFV